MAYSDDEKLSAIETAVESAPWWGKLLTSIVPTRDSSERKQYRWRVRIAIVACSAFFVSGYMLAAYIHFPPFVDSIVRSEEFSAHLQAEKARNDAQDAERVTLVNSINEQWANQLDAQIMQLRKDQCRLQNTKNKEAASIIFDKIRERMFRYVKLTGQPYELPRCEDV